MLHRSLERKRSGARKTRPDLKAGAADLPAGWSQKIEGWWRSWYFDRSDWPARRAEWLALGPLARRILVENLIRYYVLAWDDGAAAKVRRAEGEILRFQDLAASYLIEALAGGFGDNVARNSVGELFVNMDPSVIEKIEAAYAGAGPAGRRSLARALKKIRKPEALPLLTRIALGSDSWQVRIEAVQGLGDLRDSRAAATLVRCLDDADQSVRKFAARALSLTGVASPAVVLGLVACMERFLTASQIEGARVCTRSLRALTGQRLRTDPRAWRAWIAARRGRDG